MQPFSIVCHTRAAGAAAVRRDAAAVACQNNSAGCAEESGPSALQSYIMKLLYVANI